MAHYELNDEKHGIELYFDDEFPDEEVRSHMKAAGLRWGVYKRCWYTLQSNEEGVKFIKEYCGEETAPLSKESTSARKAAAIDSSIMNRRCCYSNTLEGFYKETESSWLATMKSAFSDEYMMELGSSQIAAWRDCFRNLRSNLPKLETKNFGIIFEYALPYESGRRPDVLLISDEQVFILEFKMKSEFCLEDLDQVAAYERDIREYHYESRDKSITPILVITRATGKRPRLDQYVLTCSADQLAEAINQNTADTVTPCDLNAWMDSKYEPLPTIVDAAHRIMDHEALPNIRRVNSTCIPKTLKTLKALTNYAKRYKKHTIAFVTGVPGAGKTYLGLQYVYDIREEDSKVNSVFLSGNGPLVRVLTDALHSDVFVKDLHKVENEFLHARGGKLDFHSNVIVFDEGQRAWDRKQMAKKNRGNQSEPDVMIRLAETCLDWCVLLILVGEGQEIYNGENSGIEQWNTALMNGGKDWDVICPPKLYPAFKSQHILKEMRPEVFDLTVSLRSHLAGAVSTFVNALIDGDLSVAKKIVPSLYLEGYKMYFTRDLEAAKKHCRGRYEGELSKRYGLMASSRAYSLEKYGMKPMFRPDIAAWFNRPVSDPQSCCALNVTISEFDCQGLELDMPIIGWGTDVTWTGSEWRSMYRAGSDDDAYRINSYRVLLTRGRDGFIVFIPKEEALDAVAEVFSEIEIKEL